MPAMVDHVLRQFFDALLDAYGPQGWWPGKTRTEIVVGAILTQNTNWSNVEKAIAQLQAADLLTWAALRDVPVEQLAEVIRPAGCYRVKAGRLKNFITWLWEQHDGRFDDLSLIGSTELRSQLLSINGIGAETADSIMLYALDVPTFVVDSYTARILGRHGLIAPPAGYEEIKALFEDSLLADTAMFNEYHALLVAAGKRQCKTRARCEDCPLRPFPHIIPDA